MPEAPPAVHILGVRVDAIQLSGALDRCRAMMAADGAHQLVTVNPELIVQARHAPAFRRVLAQADLALADGVGVIAAARLLGRPLPGRITGVDMTLALAALAEREGYRLFLLGAAAGVAEAAAAALRRRHPRVTIAGVHAGSPAATDAIAAIRLAAPDILLVAYGTPVQEMWIAEHQAELGVPLAMGVGGTFDYLSGRVRRAPAVVRGLGLEWLFRLVRQPRRWRRQLRLPVFVALALSEALTRRSGRILAPRREP